MSTPWRCPPTPSKQKKQNKNGPLHTAYSSLLVLACTLSLSLSLSLSVALSLFCSSALGRRPQTQKSAASSFGFCVVLLRQTGQVGCASKRSGHRVDEGRERATKTHEVERAKSSETEKTRSRLPLSTSRIVSCCLKTERDRESDRSSRECVSDCLFVCVCV